MKTIKVNAYNYQELNQNGRNRVKNWLDEMPYDYEEEDNKGNIIKKLDYPSSWEEIDIQEHCNDNEYLFDKDGNCVHHLETTKGDK